MRKKLYQFLMIILIVSIHPFGTGSQAYSQQSVFDIGSGATCEVQAGVDICVDTILVYGTFIMNGTYCGLPTGVISTYVELPEEFMLYNNYPNPFNPVTHIKFDIPKQSNTKLILYDIIGREVARLVDKNLPAGAYTVIYNASALSSGTYFYKIITDEYTDIKKMILVK